MIDIQANILRDTYRIEVTNSNYPKLKLVTSKQYYLPGENDVNEAIDDFLKLYPTTVNQKDGIKTRVIEE